MGRSVIFCLFLSAVCLPTESGKGRGKLNPVILIPGDGGSQLEAKLNKPTVISKLCTKTTDYWFDLWLSIKLLFPKIIKCLADNMRLVYDTKTRTTSNSPGVQIRVPGFGTTETVEWFDSSHNPILRHFSRYFHDIVDALVDIGYERNISVRGAPYDFRKAPNEQELYFKHFQNLIEDTYFKNSNTSVVLLAHSMGNLMTLYFLNHMTPTWKTKFIRSFISLAGPWGGAVKSLILMISGDNLRVPVINPLNVRRQQRSMPSTAWLMPSGEFWGPDERLVVAPAKIYKMKDMKTLFHDINYTTGYMMREDTKTLVHPLKAPGIELHCLNGVNVPTPENLTYTSKTWHDGTPELSYGNGDGTVNIRSLRGCLNFQKQQKQLVRLKEFEKVGHINTLKNDGVIEEIIRIITSDWERNKPLDSGQKIRYESKAKPNKIVSALVL